MVEVIAVNNVVVDPITYTIKPFLATNDKFYLSKLLNQYLLKVPTEFT